MAALSLFLALLLGASVLHAANATQLASAMVLVAKVVMVRSRCHDIRCDGARWRTDVLARAALH